MKGFFLRVPFGCEYDKVYQSDRDKEIFMIPSDKKPVNTMWKTYGGAIHEIKTKRRLFNHWQQTIVLHIFKMEGSLQPNADIYYSDLVDDAWTPIKKSSGINDPLWILSLCFCR